MAEAIALDIGTGTTGVSIWDSKSNLLSSKSLKSGTQFRSLISIDMSKQIITLINKTKPKLIVVEDYSYGSGFFNTDQAEIVGAIKYHIYRNKTSDTHLFFIPPTTVKKQVTGSGKGRKKGIKKALKEQGFDAEDIHQYDSIGVYLSYMNLKDNNIRSIMRRSVSGSRTKSN